MKYKLINNQTKEEHLKLWKEQKSKIIYYE